MEKITQPDRLVLSFYFLFVFFIASAQNSTADFYSEIDRQVNSFSESPTNDFDTFIKFVKQNFGSDKARIRAFYTWIAVNISYDKELLDNYKLNSGMGLKRLSSSVTQHPDTVLKYKKAVCEGYSLLMNKCCETFSISAFMVVGPTKLETGEVVEDIFHAWNAVKYDSAWHLLDVTWANGYVNQMNQYKKKFSDKYFFADPREFTQDHWPLDPMWQLQNYPLGKNEFYMNLESRQRTFYNFNDSITAYLRLKDDAREYATFAHYHAFDKENVLYTKECDRVVHDKMVRYMNLAAVYFDDYQVYLKKHTGKMITAKLLRECIRLLQEPKKNLELGLKYAEGKFFFHEEIKMDFEKMIASARENSKEVNASIANYRKMLKVVK